MEKELLPKATGEWRLGKKKFSRKLELVLDAGLTADQVLADADAEPGLRVAALNTLGLVVADSGDPGAAMVLIHEALILCERQGDRHRQAALENNLADMLRAAGRNDEAMEHLKVAVAIFADVGGQPGELEPEIWKLVEW